nr:bridging integrator 3 isoform X3 [Taeniopygia guttata]
MKFLLRVLPGFIPDNSFSSPTPGVIREIPSPGASRVYSMKFLLLVLPGFIPGNFPPRPSPGTPRGLTRPVPPFAPKPGPFRVPLPVTSRPRRVTSRPLSRVTSPRRAAPAVSGAGRGGAKSGGTSGSGAGRRGKMSWIPFKIGQPKKQIVPKTVERDFEREYGKLQQLEDQTKKLQKDMKKSTDADLVSATEKTQESLSQVSGAAPADPIAPAVLFHLLQSSFHLLHVPLWSPRKVG